MLIPDRADRPKLETRIFRPRGDVRRRSDGEGFSRDDRRSAQEAEFELSGGAAFVWIVDSDGHLVMPADQIKARLAQAARAP
jgi:hypothetical protein